MTDIILIDQYTAQADGENARENSFYLRLSVEESSEVDFAFFTPMNVVIEEEMGVGVVKCRLLLDDLPGSIVNVKPIEGDFRFTLFIGKSPESVVEYNLKFYKFEFRNMSPGESGNYAIELHLISDYWESMLLERRSVSWKNIRFSQVVAETAEDCGIENVLIVDSKNSKDYIVSPYWTRHQMMKWCSSRAISKNNDTFFVFSTLPNNGLFFCPFSDLIDGIITDQLDFEPIDPRAFILAGDRLNPGDDDRLKLRDFTISSDYVDTLKQGAGGVKFGFYDFDNKKYVRGENIYSDTNENQLSDWAFMSESHEISGTFVFGDRDTTTEEVSKTLLSKKSNQLQKIRASINGVTDIQVGERINVLIPVSPEFIDIMFNEFYSGDYIITGKRTIIDLDSNNAETFFNFTRQGIDGTELNTLTSSATGKVI